jgi:hypothetical protein
MRAAKAELCEPAQPGPEVNPCAAVSLSGPEKLNLWARVRVRTG